jgi:hypothetical protein
VLVWDEVVMTSVSVNFSPLFPFEDGLSFFSPFDSTSFFLAYVFFLYCYILLASSDFLFLLRSSASILSLPCWSRVLNYSILKTLSSFSSFCRCSLAGSLVSLYNTSSKYRAPWKMSLAKLTSCKTCGAILTIIICSYTKFWGSFPF